MRQVVATLGLLLFFGILFPSRVFAVTTTVSAYPQQITNDPFTITVTVTSSSTDTNHLRVQLYKEGSTDYFGETHNGTDYYGGSDGKDYPTITLNGSETSIIITARVGSPTTNEYDGTGQYYLRIQRYTQNGNSAPSEETKGSAVPISINLKTSVSPTSAETNEQNGAPTSTLAPIPTPIGSQTSAISLSEVYPYPQSGEKEWVELFNNASETAVVTNWFLDDGAQGSSPRAFSVTISAKSFAVVELSSGVYNNSGDAVRLLDENQIVRDAFDYTEAKEGMSFGRITIPGGSVCVQQPTKNGTNGPCHQESQKSTQGQKTATGTSPTKASTPTLAGTVRSTTSVVTTKHAPQTTINHNAVSTPMAVADEPHTPTVLSAKTKAPPRTLDRAVQISSLFSGSISLLNIFYILGKMKGIWG